MDKMRREWESDPGYSPTEEILCQASMTFRTLICNIKKKLEIAIWRRKAYRGGRPNEVVNIQQEKQRKGKHSKRRGGDVSTSWLSMPNGKPTPDHRAAWQ